MQNMHMAHLDTVEQGGCTQTGDQSDLGILVAYDSLKQRSEPAVVENQMNTPDEREPSELPERATTQLS